MFKMDDVSSGQSGRWFPFVLSRRGGERGQFAEKLKFTTYWSQQAMEFHFQDILHNNVSAKISRNKK